MTEQLVAPTFLFRFTVPCRKADELWSATGVELSDAHRIPSFGELDNRKPFADVRAGWSDKGLSFTVHVSGKKQRPWCRATRVEDSDALQVWIDTRDTHNIHRAGRFCHRFVFMPQGGGQRHDQPLAVMMPVNRARENPRDVANGVLRARNRKRIDGYILQAHVPAEALTGYDPEDYARLGFAYAVVDRELGWQTFSVGPEFPFMDDPSLWGALELVE